MKKSLKIVAGALASATLTAGYGSYRFIIVRRPEGPLPNPAQAKNEARRYYAENYLRQKLLLLARPHRRLHTQSADGTQLTGLYFPAAKQSNRTVLAVHGYRSSGLREYAFFAPMYLDALGMNLLIVDNYAHGQSGGKHIGFGYRDRLDIIRWANLLIEQQGAKCELLLQGVSMGAAAVLMAAGDTALPPAIKWVVADCPFTSMEEEIRWELRQSFHLPPFPLMPLASGFCRALAGYSFSAPNTLQYVQNIKVPTLFVHGTQDKFVPTHMGRQLHAACPAPKQLLLVPGAAHAESQLVAPESYLAAVNRLLNNFA